jgi:hypothetical protein
MEKNDRQAIKAINRAKLELSRMRKTLQFFNIKLFKILHPKFIKPHLEFAASVWNSFSKENIKERKVCKKSNKDGDRAEGNEIRRKTKGPGVNYYRSLTKKRVPHLNI